MKKVLIVSISVFVVFLTVAIFYWTRYQVIEGRPRYRINRLTGSMEMFQGRYLLEVVKYGVVAPHGVVPPEDLPEVKEEPTRPPPAPAPEKIRR